MVAMVEKRRLKFYYTIIDQSSALVASADFFGFPPHIFHYG
jgi:hypothetical protein